MATPAIQDGPAPSEPIRLSPLENLFCRAYERFDGDGMGAMVVKLGGRVEEAPLRAALGNLQRRHPRLRARITGTDGARYFHLVEPPVPIPVEMQECEGEPLPWREETARQFARKMDFASGSLARVLVLRSRAGRSSYVIFLAHHALFDGLSFLHAVDDLLRYYQEAEETGTASAVSSLPFVSCPRARSSGSLLSRFKVLARQARMRRAKVRKGWTALPETDVRPASPQWDVQVFPVEETVALVRRCRQEKASLEGALFAAAVSALTGSLAPAESRFTFFFPIDIRGELRGPQGAVSPADLGCFVSAFENMYTVRPEMPFWALARQFHDDVRAFLAAGGPALLYNVLRYARPRPTPHGHQRGTLNASVIGMAPLEKRYGSLAVEECAQIYKHDIRGTALNLVAIVVQLRLNLTVHAPGLREDVWRGFRDGIAAQLRRAMAEPRPGGRAAAS
jgi:hypothetical protein